MAGIFENYRSEYHPDTDTRLGLAIAYSRREVDAEFARRVLRRRDRELRLEMESSVLAGVLIEPLVRACPRKKFILTIRDAYSWADSWIDHDINSPLKEGSRLAELDKIRLRVADFSPTKHDLPLVERGLRPLACYFQLWGNHNTRVLQAVPEERLLVVRTQELAARIPEIAAWVGVPPRMLRSDRAGLLSAPTQHRILTMLDASYVRETAERLCGNLMRRYFPDTLFPEFGP
jgi:Sulfotransferase domain